MTEQSFCAESTYTARRTPSSKRTVIATRELHKFGGSSLADVACFHRVANIAREHCGSADLFVVSAAGKTTNRLIQFVDHCGHDPFAARLGLVTLFQYQLELVNGLLTGESRARVSKALRDEFTWIRSHADAAVEGPVRSKILGHGEVWSARLLSALLNQFGLLSDWLDSRTVLRAEQGALPVINESQSRPLVQHAIESLPGQRVVITGFMASSEDGQTVLLGRNGSDYSATMVGILAGCPQITIWSDVAGVYTADPRFVEGARLIPRLSVAEANELARLAGPVLHTRSLQPVIAHRASVRMRSSHTPVSGSTTLNREVTSVGPKVINSVDSVALLTVTSPAGECAVRVASFASRALRAQNLQPLASTQKCGRYRLAFTEEVAGAAKTCLENAGFTVARSEESHSLLAVIGSGVAESQHCRDTFFEVVNGNNPSIVRESALSLVAILKNTSIKPQLQNLHFNLIGRTSA